jgi:hypothetical protein
MGTIRMPDKEMAPAVLEHPGARTTRRHLMATQKSSAPHAHPSTGDHDLHHDQDHPHACLDGYVYLGYTDIDEETDEEVERVEALPCRRCAEGA